MAWLYMIILKIKSCIKDFNLYIFCEKTYDDSLKFLETNLKIKRTSY